MRISGYFFQRRQWFTKSGHDCSSNFCSVFRMGQPKKWGQLVHGSLPAWHDGACRVWTCLWMETTSIFFNESAFPFPEILNHGLLFEVDLNSQRTGHSVICERDGPVTGFTDKLTTLQPLSQPPFSAILWMLDTKSRSWARNSKWLFHKLLPASRKISNCFVTQNGNLKKEDLVSSPAFLS